MEKRKPTYDLTSIQAAFDRPERLIATGAAVRGAAELGMGRKDMIAVIQSLRRTDFVKSMTSFANHKTWQDVYHARHEAGLIYVKFTAGRISEFLLLSFKEK
jgi:motility quorum-sensing regulator/GCU-specific mRNA interferase toxin